jgi:hypothetical protein
MKTRSRIPFFCLAIAHSASYIEGCRFVTGYVVIGHLYGHQMETLISAYSKG